jgi:DNA-binding transcriptional LysR family regulator
VFNWEDLKVFLAAYREGSIGRAADLLGVSGSTVSRRLTALEDALGQTLFVRSPDGLKPTEAAHHAWSAAEDAERSTARLQALVDHHGEVRGVVRVSLTQELLTCVLLPLWPEFSRRHPELCVEFVATTGLSDLERWEADIGIRPVKPETGENLVVTRLRDSRNALFGGRALLRERGLDPTDPAALATAAASGWTDWPWIGWSTDFAHLGLARLQDQLVPGARVVLRAPSTEYMRLAAAAGVGLSLMPRYFGLVTPNLVELPLAGIPPARPLYMLCHASVRHSARVDAVWRYLESVLRGADEAQVGEGRTALERAYGLRFADDDPEG